MYSLPLPKDSEWQEIIRIPFMLFKALLFPWIRVMQTQVFVFRLQFGSVEIGSLIFQVFSSEGRARLYFKGTAGNVWYPESSSWVRRKIILESWWGKLVGLNWHTPYKGKLVNQERKYLKKWIFKKLFRYNALVQYYFSLLHSWINDWQQNAKYNWQVYNVLVNFGLVLPFLLIPQRLLINKFNGTSWVVFFKLRSFFSCLCWICLSQKSKCLLFYGIVVLNCVCWQNKYSGDNIIWCVCIYRQGGFFSWFLVGRIIVVTAVGWGGVCSEGSSSTSVLVDVESNVCSDNAFVSLWKGLWIVLIVLLFLWTHSCFRQ